MGVARFSFADLCERPLGTSDYLAIAHAFHTVIVEGIPALEPGARDSTRRFTNLIDTLYDNGTSLIASAHTEPAGICRTGPSAAMFERTASRLVEMQSETYIRQRHASLSSAMDAKKLA